MQKNKSPDFTKVIEKYSDNIYRIALVHTQNEADAKDVVQDTFLKYVTRIKKGEPFRSDEHEKAWLIRVTLNRCADLKRSWISKSSELNDSNLPPEEFKTNADDDILNAMNSLPEKYKSVLHMFYYEEYTINEISSVLGMKSNTVKTNLARGRTMLKDFLGEEFAYEY